MTTLIVLNVLQVVARKDWGADYVTLLSYTVMYVQNWILVVLFMVQLGNQSY